MPAGEREELTVPRSTEQLRGDAEQIWRAGVDAVRSERLVGEAMRVDGTVLVIAGERVDLSATGRIIVVGAGKAGAGMAAAVEKVLGPELLEQKQVVGWVNVPADCVGRLRRIGLHAARPAGVNEPTEAGVEGAREILRLVRAAQPSDLCLYLASGGGSALLPAPAEGITLRDKLAITRHLSGAGANIEQLNTVRKQLSQVKGGGLLRACRAGRLVSLVISDVLGDPLDIISSGPTVEDPSTPRDALEVLEQFRAGGDAIPPRVLDYLRRKSRRPPPRPTCAATHHVIGNNATAVAAAQRAAQDLGYTPRAHSASASEGPAEQVGRTLARQAAQLRGGAGPDCLISGGEPVVKLVEPARRGLGGRNQQLALAALIELERLGASGVAILSGGTDGEDGPTDAAGAVVDDAVRSAARQRRLTASDSLRRNDAYRFFDALGALIKTGPTHTNVCDVRVAVVDRRQSTRT
jgi:hydroxypyruvate reductase